jgi:hypothetical protein
MMALKNRLTQLELKIKLFSKRPGCDITFFIVVPEEMQNGSFDSNSYRPAADEIEKYLKQLKGSSQCQDCKVSCAIDWASDGFKNHTLGGECSSSSPEPKISWRFCVDAEVPVLCRRIMNGERTG